MALIPRFQRLVGRPLAAADAFCDRLYGWRCNPLYQSGTIVVALLVVLIVTGIWLLLFYRVGAPWDSVDRLTANPWYGNWVRGLHRYASDAALAAAAVHALRMFVQDRTWGARTLAWVSGVALVGLVLICSWTGFIMVWDTFGHALALEVARLLDALPILSEPISRAFVGERPVPSTFFFLNLFAHSAIPLAIGLGVWIHVSRMARAALLPPTPLLWGGIGLLTAIAVLWPLPMAPEADPFTLPKHIPADWFYGFWLPITRTLPAGVAWLIAGFFTTLMLLVPRLARRTGLDHPPPSVVDRQLCTACNQCVVDCPWEAIAMVPRIDGRADLVARVSPDRCVSCGICAGSCAPMGVGPAGRTGRDQLDDVRRFLAGGTPDRVVVIACAHGAGGFGKSLEAVGTTVRPVNCVGNLHTSVIEHLVRSGAPGVLILSCPPRDCRNREGPRWLEQRVHHDREAKLQARVDRRRVRIAYANAAERAEGLAAVRAFLADVAALDRPVPETAAGLLAAPVCQPVALDQDGPR